MVSRQRIEGVLCCYLLNSQKGNQGLTGQCGVLTPSQIWKRYLEMFPRISPDCLMCPWSPSWWVTLCAVRLHSRTWIEPLHHIFLAHIIKSIMIWSSACPWTGHCTLRSTAGGLFLSSHSLTTHNSSTQQVATDWGVYAFYVSTKTVMSTLVLLTQTLQMVAKWRFSRATTQLLRK